LWNNIGIVRGFFRFLSQRLKSIRGANVEEREFSSLQDVGEAFAEDWLSLGDVVKIKGRLSRFAPIYFPIAYSPQILGSVSGSDVLMASQTILNPAPSAMNLRYLEDGILAFVFPEEATETPRITSTIHPNRLTDGVTLSALPASSAAPSVPVLLDAPQLKRLENRVEVIGLVRPLHPTIESEIERSAEDFVKLYYHGFYRSDWFPDHGFMIDARSSVGGSIRIISEPSPFLVNVVVEAAFQTRLDREEFEDAVNVATDRAQVPPNRHGMVGLRANYRPAYYTPGGYEIMQVNRIPFTTHFAYEKRTLQLGVLLDATQSLDGISKVFAPMAREIIAELQRRDGEIEFGVLFQSDPSLPGMVGLPPTQRES
jgi:hypothetical protein